MFIFLVLISFLILGNANNAYSEQPIPYATLTGKVTTQAHSPIPGVKVTLKPRAYGYGTQDYTATTDRNGKYEIQNIKRYVYSSGSLPKWVTYSVSTEIPAAYTGPSFDFTTSTKRTQNIKLPMSRQALKQYLKTLDKKTKKTKF